jgi:hypothetical protein
MTTPEALTQIIEGAFAEPVGGGRNTLAYGRYPPRATRCRTLRGPRDPEHPIARLVHE